MADSFKTKIIALVNKANKSDDPRTALLDCLAHEYAMALPEQRIIMDEILIPVVEDTHLAKSKINEIMSDINHPLHHILLANSPLLDEAELLNIALKADINSLLALAKRNYIPDNVMASMAKQGGREVVAAMVGNFQLPISAHLAAEWLIDYREDYDFLNLGITRMRRGDSVFSSILKGLTSHLPTFPEKLKPAMKYDFIKGLAWPEHIFLNAIYGEEAKNIEFLGIYAQIPPRKVKAILEEFPDGLYLIYHKSRFPQELFQIFKKAWDFGDKQMAPKDEHERTVYGFDRTKEIIEDMRRYDDGEKTLQDFKIMGPTDLYKAFNEHCKSPMMAYLQRKPVNREDKKGLEKQTSKKPLDEKEPPLNDHRLKKIKDNEKELA